MLTAKQKTEFLNIIRGLIRTEINPLPIMKAAKVVSVQSTTLTATFIGETGSVSGIPFIHGATFSVNDVVFVITNQTPNVSSWLAVKVQQ